MGRKINPVGFRLSVRRDWKSRWYAKGAEFAEMVKTDSRARRFIEEKYAQASVSFIEIERTAHAVRVIVHSARPGAVIGKKGEGIERLRAELRGIFGVNELSVDIREVMQPEANAALIAANIAGQLERRVMFRRAMRRAMASAMRLGVDGVKIMSSGRLNGIEIARTESYHEGRVPLHTLKNDIDYGFAEAKTAMGVVGVKVWVSRGDKHGKTKKAKYTLAGGDPADGDAAAGVDGAGTVPVAGAELEALSEGAVAVKSAQAEGDKAQQSSPSSATVIVESAPATPLPMPPGTPLATPLATPLTEDGNTPLADAESDMQKKEKDDAAAEQD